ncbi:MAG: cytochrome c biogenesis protein CcsA [Gemmatales bacterium]|nr:cytochrome c biogenesis protein CcsA [Gemmatales bacterium]
MAMAPEHNHSAGNGSATAPPPGLWSEIRQLLGLALRIAGSLWVTVTLFSLALVLVFFGTLAQVEMGIWTVVHNYFRSSGIVWLPLRLLGHVPGLDSIRTLRDLPWSIPFPGGWLLGWALLINLLAALVMQFRLGWKWLGVWALHVGVIVLMFGELITGLAAVEANMVLQIGERCNFIEDSLRYEIALIRADRTDVEDAVVIPHRFWLIPERKTPILISHPELPADVEILAAWKNSTVQPVGENESSQGRDPFLVSSREGMWRIVEVPEAPGINPGEDMPAVHLRLREKESQRILGEYVLSLWMDRNGNRRLLSFPPILVPIGDHLYQLTLRRQRIYLPFTFELKNFVHTTYPGTSIPKEFRSDIRLYEPNTTDGRDVVITMNQPLSLEGLTFYQSGYLPDDSGTILQVVRNPGRWLPYLGCLIVAAGMLAHFLLHLAGFLRRTQQLPARPQSSLGDTTLQATHRRASKLRRSKPALNDTEAQDVASKTEVQLLHWLPWIAGGLVAVYLVLPWLPSGAVQNFDVHEFGALPVLQARIKPWDSVARTSLLAISGRQTVTDNKGRTIPAIVWLLDVITQRPQAEQYRVFRIDNDEVLSLLGLERRPGNRYALAEFRTRLEELLHQAHEAGRKEKEAQTVYDRQVLKLANQFLLYQRLAQLDDPQLRRIFNDIQDELRPLAPRSGRLEDWQNYHAGDTERAAALQRFLRTLPSEEVAAAQKDARLLELLARKYSQSLQEFLEQHTSPSYRHLRDILDAWRDQDARRFNEAVYEYRAHLQETQPAWVLRKTSIESAFNRSGVFYHTAAVYGVAFVLACLGFLTYYGSLIWPMRFQKLAFGMLVVAAVMHTVGLLVRMYLQGRPPVTNLYSSAIFIGWAGVVLGLILERIYRLGLGNATAAALGGVTLIIAHHLATDDTLGVLQAVLDTNFWLATHVTCITLGYTATFLAGAIAIAFVIVGLATRALAQPTVLRTFYGMMYGVICFAILFSFTGTVLGGLWADVSWGRFWGWDPKENGALMIVLTNALALHARWGGIVKARGFALLCILGNIVTAWSWFGTNQMGIGLHSYGRMEGATLWLSVFWLSQLALIGVGLLPLRFWRSFQTPASSERTSSNVYQN